MAAILSGLNLISRRIKNSYPADRMLDLNIDSDSSASPVEWEPGGK